MKEPTEFTWSEEPDPEDFKEVPPRPPGPLSSFPEKKYLLLPVVLFLSFYILSSIFYAYPVGEKLWVSGGKVFAEKEYWRLLTALFVHRDIVHLLSNGWLFIIFGWMLVNYFGLKLFPLASFAAGMLANLFTVWIYNPSTKLIGASGMCYAMIALWLVFYVRHDTDHTVPGRFLRAIGFSLAMLFPTTFSPTTSYLAHASGFVLGIIAGVVFLPFVKIRVKADSHDETPGSNIPE